MLIAFFIGLVIFIAETIGRFVGSFSLFGYVFPPYIFVIPIMFPLRDLAQERHSRKILFFGMLVGSLSYVVWVDSRLTLYSALAYFWAEMVAWIIYGMTRRFGWLPAMILADVISAPLVVLFFRILRDKQRIHYPFHFIPAQVLILSLCFLVITSVTPIRRLYKGQAIRRAGDGND